MNAALESRLGSTGQNGAARSRAALGLTRLHKYVAGAWGFGDEPSNRSRGAFGGWDRITGQCVEGRYKSTAELLDLRESVRLTSRFSRLTTVPCASVPA